MIHYRRIAAWTIAMAVAMATTARVAGAQDKPDDKPEEKAAAPSSERLGQQGQIVISSDLAFSMTYTNVSAGSGNTHRDSIISLLLGPAADYFISTNLSLGGAAQLLYLKQGPVNSTGVGIAPRAGLLIPLSDKLSFWPRVSVGFYSISSTQKLEASTAPGSPAGQTDVTETNTHKLVQAAIFAPLTYELATHFFVGLGPSLSIDLYSKSGRINADRTTTIGISSVVGGYF